MSNANEYSEGAPPLRSEGRGRLDLIIEEVKTSEGQVEFQVTPDPRRYERVKADGEVCYIDRFTRVMLPIRLFQDAISTLPFYDLRPRIASTIDYAQERASAVEDELAGESLRSPSVEPARHREMQGRTTITSTPFLSLDICRSTELRRREPTSFDRAAEILLREMQILVGQFEATILKATGDGFIAYLPHPAFTRQCDLIVDLGTSMIRMARDSICPMLHASGLPHLDIRIGADYGEARFEQKTNAVTGFTWPHVDSDALNLAVKIEQTARANSLRIGSSLYRLLHVQWLERATLIPAEDLPSSFNGYSVYEIS